MDGFWGSARACKLPKKLKGGLPDANVCKNDMGGLAVRVEDLYVTDNAGAVSSIVGQVRPPAWLLRASSTRMCTSLLRTGCYL